MTSKSQALIFQLAQHLSLLHTDQADILSYFGELERLIQDYRTFITPLDFPTDHEKQRQHTLLLQRTRELLASTPKEDLATAIYCFQVERTEQVRLVLDRAFAEARRFQHNSIDAEHLLLGLLREEESVAAKVLANLGVQSNKVRDDVEFLIDHSDDIITGSISLSPRAKKVIEFAVDEARQMHQHSLGTEHLLLGLVRMGEGIAANILESLGVSLEKARAQTIQVLSQME